MNRRGFLGSILSACAAIYVPCAFARRQHYAAFARDGLLFTPYWRRWRVGERCYDISRDAVLMCARESVSLECRIDRTALPDFGRTPLQIGYAGVIRLSPVWIESPTTQDLARKALERGCSIDEAARLHVEETALAPKRPWRRA